MIKGPFLLWTKANVMIHLIHLHRFGIIQVNAAGTKDVRTVWKQFGEDIKNSCEYLWFSSPDSHLDCLSHIKICFGLLKRIKCWFSFTTCMCNSYFWGIQFSFPPCPLLRQGERQPIPPISLLHVIHWLLLAMTWLGLIKLSPNLLVLSLCAYLLFIYLQIFKLKKKKKTPFRKWEITLHFRLG